MAVKNFLEKHKEFLFAVKKIARVITTRAEISPEYFQDCAKLKAVRKKKIPPLELPEERFFKNKWGFNPPKNLKWPLPEIHDALMLLAPEHPFLGSVRVVRHFDHKSDSPLLIRMEVDPSFTADFLAAQFKEHILEFQKAHWIKPKRMRLEGIADEYLYGLCKRLGFKKKKVIELLCGPYRDNLVESRLQKIKRISRKSRVK